MSNVTIEISVSKETNITINNPSGQKDDPAFLTAVMMVTLFQDYVSEHSPDHLAAAKLFAVPNQKIARGNQ